MVRKWRKSGGKKTSNVYFSIYEKICTHFKNDMCEALQHSRLFTAKNKNNRIEQI